MIKIVTREQYEKARELFGQAVKYQKFLGDTFQELEKVLEVDVEAGEYLGYITDEINLDKPNFDLAMRKEYPGIEIVDDEDEIVKFGTI